MYDSTYKAHVGDVIRAWPSERFDNLHPVGRNGMHRYNNQDHSMLTAMLAVENILGADHDLWDRQCGTVVPRGARRSAETVESAPAPGRPAGGNRRGHLGGRPAGGGLSREGPLPTLSVIVPTITAAPP